MPEVRSEADAAEIPREPWTRGLGHHAIALVLSAAFLDRLPAIAWTAGRPGPGILGVALGGLAAFVLLYLAPASRAFRRRRSFDDLAATTFGGRGARLVPGLPLIVVHVLSMAVVLGLAADYGVRGLSNLGLLDDADLRERTFLGLTLAPPVILFETAAWALFATVMAAYAVRVVSAVMFTYPVFPALALALATLAGLTDSDPTGSLAPPGRDSAATTLALLLTAQYTCGFLAASLPTLVDWAAASVADRDVTLGGLVGLVIAPLVLGTLALTVVGTTLLDGPSDAVPAGAGIEADAAPMLPRPMPRPPAEERLAILLGHGLPAESTPLPPRAADRTLGSALQFGIGGIRGGMPLLIFALGLLGPVVYAPYHVSRSVRRLAPTVSPLIGAFVCATLAWLLVITGLAGNVGAIYGLIGALVGPVAGAIAADVVRGDPADPGSRPLYRARGLIAWGIGLAIGLLPFLGGLPGLEAFRYAQPATLLAFAAAFVVGLVGTGRGVPTQIGVTTTTR